MEIYRGVLISDMFTPKAENDPDVAGSDRMVHIGGFWW